jgi:hypothetical protein
LEKIVALSFSTVDRQIEDRPTDLGSITAYVLKQSRFVDAHRDDGKRFIVRADEKLTAFVELERAIHQFTVELIT